MQAGSELLAFVSPAAVRLLLDHPRSRLGTIDGTIAFFDVSGFTRLSERLARLGKLGAESITLIVDGIYTGLIDAAFRHGGDVLQFSGDALLVYFGAPDHEVRAALAAVEMYDFLGREGRLTTDSGAVRLRMSAGMHAARFDVALVGNEQLFPLVWGAEVTRALQCEKDADAGQVMVSAALADALPNGWTRATAADTRMVRLGAIRSEVPALGAPPVADAPEAVVRLVPTPLRQLTVGATAGEHRPLTAAFVALKQHGEFAARHGSAALADALLVTGAAVDEVCARWDVLWVSADALVDACDFFLVAGAPRVAEDDEERMLRAMVELNGRDLPMPLSIGVNRGRVFAGPVGHPERQTYGVTGDGANLAARVMARADSGDLLATRAVLDRVRARVHATPMPPFMAKGKRAPVETERVDTVADRLVATDAPQIVGREPELERLREHLATVRRGTGAVIDVVAEPGIGKSRLLDAFLASSPVPAIRAFTNPYSRATPYAAVRTLVRDALGIGRDSDPAAAGTELVRALGRVDRDLVAWAPLVATVIGASVPATPEVDRLAPEYAAERLVRTTVDVLVAAATDPTVVLIEDVHWADEASIAVLAALAARVDETSWLICTTRRPGDAWTDQAIELLLAPIDARAAHELLAAVVGEHGITDRVAASMVERAQGNPLFLRELVTVAGEGELPETIEQVLGAQMDALPASQRLRLREAAVVGATVDLALLARAVGEPELADAAAWTRLAAFVDVAEGQLRFRHDLARTTAYEGLGYRRRRELHGAIADALRGRVDPGATDSTAPLLALHYSEAHRWADAWEWSRTAADLAVVQSAAGDAFVLLGRALDAAARVPDLTGPELAAVAEQRADLALRLGLSDEAHRALRLSRTHRDRDVAGTVRCLRKHGDVAEREGRYAPAMRWHRRALRAAATDPTPAVQREALQARLSYAVALYFQGRLRDAIAWCEPVCAEARALDDEAALAQACMQIEGAAAELSPPESHGLADLAEGIFRELGDDVSLGNLQLNLGIVAFKSSEWTQASKRYEAAAVAFERAGDEVGAALARNNLAELLTDQGRDAEARAHLEHARRVFQASRYQYGIGLTEDGLARLDLRAGEPESAVARLDAAMVIFGELGATVLVVDTMVRRVEWHLMNEDPAAALDAIEAAEVVAATTDAIAILPATIARLRAEATTWRDGPEAGLALARIAVETARTEQSTYEELRSLDVVARIETALGRDGREAGDARDRLIATLRVVRIPEVRWNQA